MRSQSLEDACLIARCSREILEHPRVFRLPDISSPYQPNTLILSPFLIPPPPPWVFVHGVQLFCFLSFNNLMKTEDGA